MNKIGKENTSMNLWWPRIVGLLLAVLILSTLFLYNISQIVFLVGVAAAAAIAFFWKGIAGVIAVRWCARTVGVVAGVLLATLFILEIVGGTGMGMTTIIEWVTVFMWVAVFVGIVITFFWEGIGGAIVAFAALALQLLNTTEGVPLQPKNFVFVFFGLASIYCWWRTRRLSLRSPSLQHESLVTDDA
jgi:hypothetical protein